MPREQELNIVCCLCVTERNDKKAKAHQLGEEPDCEGNLFDVYICPDCENTTDAECIESFDDIEAYNKWALKARVAGATI